MDRAYYCSVILLAAIFLCGCSTIASKEAIIGCQAADTLTTVHGVTHPAPQANPLMAGIINSFGIAGFVAFKAALTYFLVTRHDDIPVTALATVNVITCGAAVNNLLVIK